ncbi:MAG: Hsp20/alpha crystallin family protein [bacterium]|nr:Hsp20/alpha crystallin family protein [bacterium]
MNCVVSTKRNRGLFLDEFFDNLRTYKVVPSSSLNLTKINLEDNEKSIKVTAELPGMSKEDINIEYKEGLLSISGEKKSEEKEESKQKYYREISYGKFHRTLSTGDVKFEEAEAEYTNGVLTITLPKAEKSRPKMLEIK